MPPATPTPPPNNEHPQKTRDTEDVFVFPTTVGQKRFWSLDALQPGNPALNIPCAARLAGNLNLAVAQQALDETLRRHEALRCRFELEDNELMQVVYPPRAVEILD